jgi:copper chaperone CopZ
MKLLAAMLVALVLSAGISQVQGDGGKAPVTTTVMTVKGMMCASCMKSVEKALYKLDGVNEVKVDMKKDRVEVTYDGKKATPRQMVESLEKAGFRAQLPAR